MSHTNETTHYQLPQYVGTDILNPLVDTNGAYQTIDETMYNVAQTATQASADAQQASEDVATYDARITQNATDITSTQTSVGQTRKMLANNFSAVTNYTKGQFVIYDNKLYRFVNNHSGAWSASDVDEVQIGEFLNNIPTDGLIRSEEMLYTLPANASQDLLTRLKLGLMQIRSIYLNRPSNVKDVILDGIDGLIGDFYYETNISFENLLQNTLKFNWSINQGYLEMQTNPNDSYVASTSYITFQWTGSEFNATAYAHSLHFDRSLTPSASGYAITQRAAYQQNWGESTTYSSRPAIFAYHYEYEI